MPPTESFARSVQLLWETVWSSHRRVSHLHLVQQEEKHTARPGRTRPQHHFFRENRSWCIEGSWERKSGSLSVQTSPSYFSRPSKFIATRYTATSLWFPASVLANLVCALAFVHPIHSIEATKKHQKGRRMLTPRSLHSANPAT